jgi:diaminohydroxyphosphoribosylaminopyrimidine deaminase/5-amino-6-(5-phosphoribosylamino)uracil reductase
LEPCSHFGKTPPCVNAILQTGIRRVVVAMRDPNPQINGCGLQILRDAGIEVTETVLEAEARRLNAPYLTLLEKNRPWIHAKWAMTLDGKLAARTGHSRWISGETSRQIVQQLRSRMDAVIIGSGTARQDDPLLTVRIPDPRRIPLRIVLDSHAGISPASSLVQSANDVPTLIVVRSDAPSEKLDRLRQSGCEVLALPGNHRERIEALLKHLAERQLTNLLAEGGSRLFGTLFDMELIDEVHAFIAPKLTGGEQAISVIGGQGFANMTLASSLEVPKIQVVENDIYVRGRVRRLPINEPASNEVGLNLDLHYSAKSAVER